MMNPYFYAMRCYIAFIYLNVCLLFVQLGSQEFSSKEVLPICANATWSRGDGSRARHGAAYSITGRRAADRAGPGGAARVRGAGPRAGRARGSTTRSSTSVAVARRGRAERARRVARDPPP